MSTPASATVLNGVPSGWMNNNWTLPPVAYVRFRLPDPPASPTDVPVVPELDAVDESGQRYPVAVDWERGIAGILPGYSGRPRNVVVSGRSGEKTLFRVSIPSLPAAPPPFQRAVSIESPIRAILRPGRFRSEIVITSKKALPPDIHYGVRVLRAGNQDYRGLSPFVYSGDLSYRENDPLRPPDFIAYLPYSEQLSILEVQVRKIKTKRVESRVRLQSGVIVNVFGVPCYKLDHDIRVISPEGIVVTAPKQFIHPYRKPRSSTRETRISLLAVNRNGYVSKLHPGTSSNDVLIKPFAPTPDAIGTDILSFGSARLTAATKAASPKVGPVDLVVDVAADVVESSREDTYVIPVERNSAAPKKGQPGARPDGEKTHR